MNIDQTLHMLFRQKAWANVDLFAAVATIDANTHADARHTAIRLLNHVFTVDQIFRAHLTGVEHGHNATNTVDTPTLEALQTSVQALDGWYVNYVATTPSAALTEEIEFTFTDGKPGRMSRSEMLHHVVLHGSYHRGAVGRIIVQAGGPPLPDSITSFLHRSEPECRQRA
ncbi:MAG: damage-inducible protein DinB [Burkholderiales bacterium]|nr:MAG: damage-inducible protein DinB [Burkholderiales bacterium]TAG80943.1 MAG: damage-inducible protein DinB [Betaproteobacteria bacterium]